MGDWDGMGWDGRTGNQMRWSHREEDGHTGNGMAILGMGWPYWEWDGHTGDGMPYWGWDAILGMGWPHWEANGVTPMPPTPTPPPDSPSPPFGVAVGGRQHPQAVDEDPPAMDVLLGAQEDHLVGVALLLAAVPPHDPVLIPRGRWGSRGTAQPSHFLPLPPGSFQILPVPPSSSWTFSVPPSSS